MGFFEQVGWGCFQGPICLWTLILLTFLLRDLLEVGLLGAVIQGICSIILLILSMVSITRFFSIRISRLKDLENLRIHAFFYKHQQL